MTAVAAAPAHLWLNNGYTQPYHPCILCAAQLICSLALICLPFCHGPTLPYSQSLFSSPFSFVVPQARFCRKLCAPAMASLLAAWRRQLCAS